MDKITIAGPLFPGKEEPWRRFVQELAGSRAVECEMMKQRLGIRNLEVWLVRVPRASYKGEMVMVHLEAEDLEKLTQRLEASEHPFDLWLKDQLSEYHGFPEPSSKAAPELILGL